MPAINRQADRCDPSRPDEAVNAPGPRVFAAIAVRRVAVPVHGIRTFVVSGGRSAEFPVDMLRYDQAFPKEAADAAGLIDGERRARRVLTLCSHDPYAPHVARWESFGWRVESVDGSEELAIAMGAHL